MNVGDLRKALAGLPDDMRVDAFTTDDPEFTVRLAVVHSVPGFPDRVLLIDDPTEFDSKRERLLHADDVEGED